MRFTLAQLRKFSMPYHYSEEMNVSNELEHFEDIISASFVKVDYEIRERGRDTYLVSFHFKIELKLECSVTLQEVPYSIDADAEELFSTDENYEDAFMIENQTLDTKEAILTNILIHKPMKVTASGVVFEDDGDDEQPINSAFAKLKDLL